MSDYNEHHHPNRRKCDDCIEHSGVTAQLEHLAISMEEVKESIKILQNWGIKILVGVILCAMTAFFSSITALYLSQQRKIDSLNHYPRIEIVEPAIIVERIDDAS